MVTSFECDRCGVAPDEVFLDAPGAGAVAGPRDGRRAGIRNPATSRSAMARHRNTIGKPPRLSSAITRSQPKVTGVTHGSVPGLSGTPYRRRGSSGSRPSRSFRRIGPSGRRSGDASSPQVNGNLGCERCN